MTAAEILERVRGWFSRSDGNGGGPAARPAHRPAAAAAAYLAGRGKSERDNDTGGTGTGQPARSASAAAPADGCADAPAPHSVRPSAPCPGRLPGGRETAIRNPPCVDPLDPPWLESLEGIPAQIAASAADRATAARALERIAGELDGHRQAARTLAAAMQRLPDIAAGHAELSRETNRLLERQAFVLESIVDALTALRAAFGNVEESARRNQKAIAMLEASHRQILFEYQAMFLRSHRLVGCLAAAATILAAAALGAAAYVVWAVFGRA